MALEVDIEPPIVLPSSKRRHMDFAVRSDVTPPGPSSARESVHWAAVDVAALHTRGLHYFDIDYNSRLLLAMVKGICLRSDYSGMGSADEALRKVALATERHHGVELQHITVQRAGDLLAQC